MLPGFRFLFVAIVLSLSILVFGLGAAALLRAAHEEVASTPSWHPPPETVFAQRPEAARPVLAMLRVEPQLAEPKAPDNPQAAAEAGQPASSNIAAPNEQAPGVAAPAAPERTAALEPEQSSTSQTAKSELAKSELAVSETPAQSQATSAAAGAPAAADTAGTAAPDAESKVASTEQAAAPAQIPPPGSEAAAVESEPAASAQTIAPASPQANAASTKIATLGGPPVSIEAPQPAKASEKPDSTAVKKHQQARRAAHRRRIAARTRQAQLTQAQPAADPFAQPSVVPPRVAARKR